MKKLCYRNHTWKNAYPHQISKRTVSFRFASARWPQVSRELMSIGVLSDPRTIRATNHSKIMSGVMSPWNAVLSGPRTLLGTVRPN
jgi:hypothetical protein